jgi:pyroglutamyl-peptidase
VHLGLAGGRARLALERVAVNVMDFEIADNAGYRATGEPCVAGGPAAYFSTLPLEAMLEALGADGVPAYLSSSAGTYLCNQTFYTTRHLLASQGHEIPAGFIHLPLSPSMVVAAGLDQPSMDVPLMIRAIELVLRVVARSTPSVTTLPPSARTTVCSWWPCRSPRRRRSCRHSPRRSGPRTSSSAPSPPS